jgi:hypothetical protein
MWLKPETRIWIGEQGQEHGDSAAYTTQLFPYFIPSVFFWPYVYIWQATGAINV